MFQIIAAMAEFERALISERVRAGLANAKAHGRLGGRPKVQRDRDRDAQAIRQMRDAGDSLSEIAAELGRSKADIARVCIALNCSPMA